MTFKKSFALLYVCCFLFPVLSGQHQNQSIDTNRLSTEQLFLIETLASTDSVDNELDVPNVFTPNGDKVNDYFEVTTDGTTVYEFSVFTRTGTRVFYSRSPRIFWDGKTSGGLDMKEGVYYYVIEETGDSEPFDKAGFIHLYR
ncbi:MAG: gliding motility-associated C-terminal domain-containing protein [Bacteroidales bacterium]|nr:gliding motility-associated C-terminal domain-containing protein [Bacteroidales bacterium]